jgi:tape measure domain-containing protein
LNFEGPFRTLKNAISGVIGKFTLVQTAANLFTSAIQGIGSAIVGLVNNAVEMQVLDLQLQAFTGSASNAAKAFEDFGRTAEATPFDLKQVANAGKIMMAFGVSTQNSTKFTNKLAIAAAATGGELNNLARNLGQISAQGRAYTRDLTQFAMQGIPIWQELSNVTGQSVASLKQMAADGAIGFNEVAAALENLTKEGSAFANIAEEMGNTIAGQGAQMQQAFDKLALAVIKTFVEFDKAFGNVTINLMKAFTQSLNLVSNNLSTIVKFTGAATAATVAYLAISNWKGLAGLLQVYTFAMKGLALATKAAAVAQGVLSGLVGNFPAIAAGIAAGALVYSALTERIEGAAAAEADRQRQALTGIAAEGTAIDQNIQKLMEQKTSLGVLATQYNALNEIADAYKKTLDEEVQKLEAMKAALEKRYQEEEKQVEKLIQQKEQAITREQEAHRKLVSDKREAHRQELQNIRTEYDEKIKLIDAEIGRLRERTPSEQKLYELEKRKLEAAIQKGGVDAEQMLRLRARLERMNREEEIQKRQNEKAALRRQEEQKINDTKAKQKQEMDKINKAHQDLMTQMQKNLEKEQENLARMKETHRERLAQISETISEVKGYNKELDLGKQAIDGQIARVRSLGLEWEKTAAKAREAKAELQKQAAAQQQAAQAAAQKDQQSSISGSGKGYFEGLFTGRASGGPVTGGSTYTVNELGKEAFLSAQGRLSMINAPSYGQWTAPSSGTVIPAHLTKQLNVPSGGININRAASNNAMRAGASSGNGSLVSAIKSAMGGDSITNNVTIQAANTTQAASDMLVEMTKLRRRRYS